MAQTVNVCGSTTTLSAGENFTFTNFTSSVCHVSNCSPPLTSSGYTVPAAQGAVPGTCPAQVQSSVSSGNYTLSCDCCAQPDSNPKIIIP